MRVRWKSRRGILACSTVLVTAAVAGGAGAAEFQVNDDISITTNVSISAGVTFRTEEASSESLFSGNAATLGKVGVAGSATQDDGNLNFDRGDLVSSPFTIVADAEFNYRDDIGFFIRGKGVYDPALDLREVAFGHAPNGFTPGTQLEDEGFNTLAQFATADVLDAFLFSDVVVEDIPIDIRAGRQVVSWGEGTFIQNGINSINPIDVTAFRKPGVQLKEGLLPLGMIYANAGVTDNLSLEAFWNFEWQQTQPDGCGTFFSTVDVIAQGCDILSLASFGAAITPALDSDPEVLAANFVLTRATDVGPDDFDFDNFGISPRLYVPSIDTEFGFYLTRLDSRLPALSFTAGTAATTPGLGLLSIGGGEPDAARYNVQYERNIHTLGLSAATTLFGLAVAGEVSYRPDQPVQINTNDLTLAAATLGNSAIAGIENPADALFLGAPGGSLVEGFILTDQIRGQGTVIAFFDRVLGADRITTIGELGFEWLPDLDGDNPLGLNLGRASIFGNPDSSGNIAEGLTDAFSLGFRSRVEAAYTNVFAGVNMTPSFSWSQDIVGDSSDSQFIEGRTVLGFGLTFDYLNRYSLAVNYTREFGGTFNGFDDRDFAAAVFNVQF